ncbi:MAG: SDR family NAD(P)-dependent oxidoreductase [Chloroflexi bacterium]|jgi:NAD(P)-dependent dehydrogenase (short-subunit alcohol dehydrogenase family)|nr:SDR family NAD(P)-dependent oxidoreductase [Chloroflexota bacterium]
MKHIVITGVSTGIGFATAAELLRRGYHVLGSVRKAGDAQRLQLEFGEAFTPLLFDVTDGQAIGTAVEQVQEIVGERGLYALINNAGIVIPGPLSVTPLEDFQAQFEVNVFGLLDVTQRFLPLLGARKNVPTPPGRVINISSVSGKIAYPFMGAYAASKHALEALSDSLRRELMLYGVDVIVIEPGTTRTPIKDKYKEQIQRYAQTDYGTLFANLEAQLAERERTGLPVEQVVEAICKALENKHPKTRYAVPRKRLTGWLIPRWLPDRWLDRLSASQLGITR